jgi:hypothetical protein
MKTKCERTVCKKTSDDPKRDGWVWVEGYLGRDGWWCRECLEELEAYLAARGIFPTKASLH